VNSLTLEGAAGLRLAVFLGVLAAMALWEAGAPRRPLTTPKAGRWGRNLGLALLNGACVQLLVPLQAVGVAALAEGKGWGLLRLAGLPLLPSILLTVVLLDLLIYLQHRWFHRTPLLWRLHLVHHVDLDIDVTTGARFHPVEILLSMGIKMAAVAVIGAPVAGVVLFEVLLNATSMFNHGNVRIAKPVDRLLRLALVTPDMHRVHHSVIPRETASNFGFNLPWWDRIFGTYRPQPAAGHAGMVIGLPWIRDPKRVGFGRLLALPFSRPGR
jgi:sterol desaturase/sphingolipid hydroxylase (fatty acid hydroxylase superfamily)